MIKPWKKIPEPQVLGWVTHIKIGTTWEKNRGTFYSSEVINIFFVNIIKDVIKCMMHGINKEFKKRIGSTNFVEKYKYNILWQLGWMKILLDENTIKFTGLRV
jgi:hypothetical protein